MKKRGRTEKRRSRLVARLSHEHDQSKRRRFATHRACRLYTEGLPNDTYLCSSGWVTWEACVKLFLGRFGAYPYTRPLPPRHSLFSFLRFLPRTEERGNESRLASTHHVNRITRNWFQCIDLVRNLCCVHQTLIDLTNWVAFINDSCKTVNTVSSRCTEAVWSSNLICIRCLMRNCVSLIIIIHFIIEK